MSQVIDKKLSAAIDKLNDRQKKELLVFVSHMTDDTQKQYDKWEDDAFVAEIESRYEHYKNGGKMISAADADKRIKKLIKGAKK